MRKFIKYGKNPMTERYSIEEMQVAAKGAATVNGLNIEGPNRKITHLLACPSMLEQCLNDIRKLEEERDKMMYCTPVENNPNFHGFIRAFWRRIEPFKNKYGKELPDELPIEFKAHMATASTLLTRK